MRIRTDMLLPIPQRKHSVKKQADASQGRKGSFCFRLALNLPTRLLSVGFSLPLSACDESYESRKREIRPRENES